MHKKWIKVVLVVFAVLVFVFFVLVLSSEALINSNSKGRLYDSISEIPSKKVGLLLGASKFTADGRVNLFYKHRLDAAVELYEAGKIKFILASGDNSTVEYNEPQTMKDDLIERGIPEEKIFLDYAGFRTWDSVVRAKAVFGEDDFIVVSQQFHNQRALYVATQNGISAIGFNAEDVPVSVSPRVWIRERLASVNTIFDVLIGRDPKFFGDQIVIE